MSDRTAAAHQAVSDALAGLETYFKPGCELTFVMRLPGSPDAYIVVTNDDLDEVIATLERSKTPAAVTPARQHEED